MSFIVYYSISQANSNCNEEDPITITIFQAGVFHVLEPIMIGDELLDAVAMGTKAEELVRAGDQYIAIDLSKLDYIYSDSINRFINLNRAILDINGRIVIVAPHAKVFELLEKAGVHNFIKICRSHEELMRISEMIAPSSSAPVFHSSIAASVTQAIPVVEASEPEVTYLNQPIEEPAPEASFESEQFSEPEQYQTQSPAEEISVPEEIFTPIALEVDDETSVESSIPEEPKVFQPIHEEIHSVAFETSVESSIPEEPR